MPNTLTDQAREFRLRYQILSQQSGYNLLYDTMALIQEFIPCKNIDLFITRPKNLDTDKVLFDSKPMLVGTKFMVDTFEPFMLLYENISFATQFGSYILSQAMANKPIQAYSFSDYEPHKKGKLHRFYQKYVVSDILVIASPVARYQFVGSPLTESYYGLILNFAHTDGQLFSQEQKDLLALCFDIFVDDFKRKIATPAGSPFLPQVTGELICKKTKLQALFSTGNKFSPRQLATIRACFDLKHQQRKITRAEVARYLHLQDQGADETQMKKALSQFDHDMDAIKIQLLRDFTPDSPEYAHYKKTFTVQHITDVFQTYAYFGLYPDTAQRYTSYLERRLAKWR